MRTGGGSIFDAFKTYSVFMMGLSAEEVSDSSWISSHGTVLECIVLRLMHPTSLGTHTEY